MTTKHIIMGHVNHNRKGDEGMEIVELNMKKYLGRGIQVFLNSGGSLNFRPMELLNGNTWRGLDDEQNVVTIENKSILFVKSKK